MLILSGVSSEITSGNVRHFILLSSPHIPGSNYKIEADQQTIKRLQCAMAVELENINNTLEINHPDELEDDRDACQGY